MWRLSYVRDWIAGCIDWLVERRVRSFGDRVEADLKRWMAENAKRSDGP